MTEHDDLDPYRPDTTVDERTDHVIGVLLSDEDPVRRYGTIRALQDGRLREVAAISLRQLRDQLGSTDAAAAAVDISRQAVNELLAKAGAPGARQDRGARDQPAYHYGIYLATVRRVAENLPAGPRREAALQRWYDLEAKAPQTLTMLPALAETATQWLRAVKPRSIDLGRLLDDAGAAIADWASNRSDPRLTVPEQAEVYIGYHHARARWQKERQAAIRAGRALRGEAAD